MVVRHMSISEMCTAVNPSTVRVETSYHLINVADDDGSSMGNAFWNGQAMFYGNGDGAFQPLARGLDVAGHEMSHGVIQSTANLEYQGESGALNESFADVFGVLIDRDDWKIGEDVVKASSISFRRIAQYGKPLQWSTCQ
jgi:Zn-dependent metalloprotease